MLLHAVGESALDWRWVLPDLTRSRRVYAPDLLGLVGGANKPADYSPAFFERFVAAYFEALEIERAAMVGNSLGGLVALRLALSEPRRVSALSLIGGAGHRRAASYALRSPTLPGYGELAVAWGKACRRCPTGLLESEVPFARPERVPDEWMFPASQAREAVARLRRGSLDLIPDCGHLPQVERPDHLVAALSVFLSGQAQH